MTEPLRLPLALPANPKGWTRRMLAHLNFGGGRGAGVFQIHDEFDQPMPIFYRYEQRRRAPTLRGFYLDGRPDELMTWDQLRAHWGTWVVSRMQQAGDVPRVTPSASP